MKKIKLNYMIPLLLTVAFAACEDPIAWDVNNDQIKLVVEGRVTNEFRRHEILLSTTADYFNANPPQSVENATVVVNDGETIFSYSESEPGIYLSDVAFAGVVGKNYTLSIELPSPLGEASLFMASSTMLPPMNVDSLYHIKEAVSENEELIVDGVEIDSVFIIGIYAQEVEEVENAYLFEVFVDEELETNTIFDLGTFSDDFIEDLYLEDFLVYEMDNSAPGDSISLVMYSVEREYITFINDLITESEGGEPLGLSGPPANVVGNLSNGGLGYFYAASVNTSYTILD